MEEESGMMEGTELISDMETETPKKTRQNSRREAEEAAEREVCITTAPPPRERPATHEAGWNREVHELPNPSRS